MTTRISLLSFIAFLLCMKVYSQECSLDKYLNQGISSNPVLKDLSNQILSTRYDSLIARAAILPQVNFNGYLMYAPTINGWGYSEVITNGQNLSGTINISQQIFNKKTREATIQKYGLESGDLANTRNISINELKKAITAQYLAAFAALEERKFQQEVLASLANEAKVVKIWTEKGIYRQTDYLSLQIEIRNLEQNIRDLDLQYRKEFWNLTLICGIDDTTSCDLQLPVIMDTVARKIENSLLFRHFLLDSLLIKNEKLQYDNKYKPALSWFADGGIVNNEPRLIYQNIGVSGGLSMTLPLFDGNQRKINYDKIRMREETRISYQENFRFRYHAQLRQLQHELETTRSFMKENEKQVSLVQELVDADKALLNIGALPISDYILALKNLMMVKHNGLQNQIRVQYILNEINFWKQ